MSKPTIRFVCVCASMFICASMCFCVSVYTVLHVQTHWNLTVNNLGLSVLKIFVEMDPGLVDMVHTCQPTKPSTFCIGPEPTTNLRTQSE